jgi:hypothetical protein
MGVRGRVCSQVGYGDMSPKTSTGRFVCLLAATLGICFAALLTAAFSSLLAWSQEEAYFPAPRLSLTFFGVQSRHALTIICFQSSATWSVTNGF